MIIIILIKCSIISSFTQGVFILEIVLHPPSEIRLQNYGKLQACKINLNHNMLVICNISHICIFLLQAQNLFLFKTSQLRFLCNTTFYHIDGNVKTAFLLHRNEIILCLSASIYVYINFLLKAAKT